MTNERVPPPGTYVGNYADEEGNILHGKHPWALKSHGNPAALLEQLETEIFRLHVKFFPMIEYVDSLQTLALMEREYRA